MQTQIRERHGKPDGALAVLQAMLCHLAAKPKRFDLLALLLAGVLAAAAPAATAQDRHAAWGPDQRNANELEVRRDALPDELPLDQIEIVVEVSDDYCKPKPVKLLGISMPGAVAHTDAAFCRHMAAYASAHAGALPMRLSRQMWSQRKVADHVAGLDVAPQRRYVLLSRWRAYDASAGVARWVVEDVLWDTADNRLLWQSLSNIFTDDKYQEGRVWGMQVKLRQHFAFTLPATLARRGAVRAHAPAPGGRWVAAEQIAGWKSASQGALAFVNNYYSSSGGVRDAFRTKSIRFREIAQVPPLTETLEWPSDAMMRRETIPLMARTPSMDFNTHALLELPPGRYVIDPYDPSRSQPFEIELKPGEMAFVEFSRNLVGADGPRLSDVTVWDKARATGRHAFLEDARVLPDGRQTECWFIGP